MLMDDSWFQGFTSDLHSPELWNTFYTAARTKDSSLPETTPPIPNIDGKALFWYVLTCHWSSAKAGAEQRELT